MSFTHQFFQPKFKNGLAQGCRLLSGPSSTFGVSAYKQHTGGGVPADLDIADLIIIVMVSASLFNPHR